MWARPLQRPCTGTQEAAPCPHCSGVSLTRPLRIRPAQRAVARSKECSLLSAVRGFFVSRSYRRHAIRPSRRGAQRPRLQTAGAPWYRKRASGSAFRHALIFPEDVLCFLLLAKCRKGRAPAAHKARISQESIKTQAHTRAVRTNYTSGT